MFEIDFKPNLDSRGAFMRTYDIDIFRSYGINHKWVQEKIIQFQKSNIIRGLHMQKSTFSETKLVRCIVEEILDVFVDLRPDSKTFCKWDSIKLSEKNNKSVLISKGCVQYFTLSEKSEVLYKVDNFYSKDHEIGLMWNDPKINIDWPVDAPMILSDKDKSNYFFDEFMGKIV